MVTVEKFREYKSGELLGQLTETERASVDCIRAEMWNTPATQTSVTVTVFYTADILNIKTYYELLGFNVHVNPEHSTVTVSWQP